MGTRLDRLTWKDAEPLLRGSDLVLIPLGARLKEHGLHLPLDNDWRLAEALAERVLQRTELLSLPTLEHGYYPAFVEYPGSVSLRRETARDLVVDVCRSLARFGPRKYYVLNTGISTCKALEPARQVLAPEGILLEYTDLSEALGPIEEGVREQEAGTHADEIETSMMLYLAPETVKLERAVKDLHPGSGSLTRDPRGAGIYSPSGAWGDPTLATAEKGRIVVERLVEHLVASIAAFRSSAYVAAPPRDRYL